MRRSLGVCAIVLCVLVLSFAVNAAAQVNTATLSGTVTDPQGLAVRGAQVTVTSATTGAQRTIVADEDGRYIFIGLPPGQYKMTVTAAGFELLEERLLAHGYGAEHHEPERHPLIFARKP